jgi:hypothetical protein
VLSVCRKNIGQASVTLLARAAKAPLTSADMTEERLKGCRRSRTPTRDNHAEALQAKMLTQDGARRIAIDVAGLRDHLGIGGRHHPRTTGDFSRNRHAYRDYWQNLE